MGRFPNMKAKKLDRSFFRYLILNLQFNSWGKVTTFMSEDQKMSGNESYQQIGDIVWIAGNELYMKTTFRLKLKSKVHFSYENHFHIGIKI